MLCKVGSASENHIGGLTTQLEQYRREVVSDGMVLELESHMVPVPSRGAKNTELAKLVRRKYLTITHLKENIYQHPRIDS